MVAELNLIAEQEQLIITLRKCYKHGRKGVLPARVAEKKFTRRLTEAGFTDQQAYAALNDARDVADLEAGK